MTEPLTSTDYLSELLRLGTTLNSSLDLTQVLNIAIDEVVRFVQAERGFILLVDETTRRVWGRATRNIDDKALEAALNGIDKANVPEVSSTVVEATMREGRAVVSHNAMADPRFETATSVRLAQVRSVVCVPLTAHGRRLGVVYLDNRIKSGIFEDRHVEMLTAFANQAAVAIENARLYENLKKSADEQLRLQNQLYANETERRALEEANRLKSDYIGYVSHELRNPLTTIRGFVQTMEDDPSLDHTTRLEFYATIGAEADRMLSLINQLLDSARLEAGHELSLNTRELDLVALVERIVRSQRFYKFWTPKHIIELTVQPEFPEIHADEEKLHQVLANVLSNAIKYSPSGGTIFVDLTFDDETVDVCVRDCGVGMSEQQQSKLFGRFERLDREDIKTISGTGLGLYLTKYLVELHGGSIACTSAEGTGTTFCTKLPRKPVAPLA